MRPGEGPTLLEADRRHATAPNLPSGSPRFFLVALSWKDFRPITIWADGHGRAASVDLAPLRGQELDLQVEGGNFCVGRIDWSDTAPRHRPCPGARRVSVFAQCASCAHIPDQAHVFEPVEDCRCAACAVPHEVYVAFHGTLPKVGMTQRTRQRLIEQGADGYVVALPAADRYEARQAERHVSAGLGVAQQRRSEDLLRVLQVPPSLDQRAGAAARIAQRLRLDLNLEPGPFEALEDYPIPVPLAGRPVLAALEARQAGTLMGLKGPLAVLAPTQGPLRALRLAGAEGHWVRLAPGCTLAKAVAQRLA